MQEECGTLVLCDICCAFFSCFLSRCAGCVEKEDGEGTLFIAGFLPVRTRRKGEEGRGGGFRGRTGEGGFGGGWRGGRDFGRPPVRGSFLGSLRVHAEKVAEANGWQWPRRFPRGTPGTRGGRP